jgi:hypothetical protein
MTIELTLFMKKALLNPCPPQCLVKVCLSKCVVMHEESCLFEIKMTFNYSFAVTVVMREIPYL